MSDEPKGVAFLPPPAGILQQAETIIKETFKELPQGTNGALVGVATTAGWNAAVVTRAGDKTEIVGWVGKNWGSGLTGGTAVRVTW